MKKRDKQIRQELEEQAPRLARYHEVLKDDGFTTPPGYFDALPDTILERIRREDAAVPRSRTTSFYRMSGRRLSRIAAAALLLIAGAYWWLMPLQPDAASSALTEEEIAAYIDANIEDFDETIVLETTAAAEMVLLPAPGAETEQLDEYYDELIRELDEENLKDFF